MKKKKFDVAALGSCSVDFLCVTAAYPAENTKNRMSAFARQGGGLAATACVALARLGAATTFIGKFGGDVFSRMALHEFEDEGVDTSHIIREDGAGPFIAFISVAKNTGARTIWWTDESVRPVRADEIKENVIASARVLHLDEYNIPAARRAAEIARGHGVITVLDAETPDKKGLLPLIKLTDFLIVPEHFATDFSGRGLEKSLDCLLKLGPAAVVITRGAKGCEVKTTAERFSRSAFRVPVVDTTGCGDVFHGAFIYGVLQNWPLEITAEFACAVAAIKCGKTGGRAGCPDLCGARSFLRRRGSKRMKQFMGIK